MSADQFHEMGRAGILAPGSRVELIDGELIDMAPIGSRHASVVSYLSMLFARSGGKAIVFTQNPIGLPPWSEPQPDLALLEPRTDHYRRELPRASDVLLVVEVADTTLRYDVGIKLPLYATHGIREVWIVDLTGRRVDVYRQPVAGSYQVKLVCLAADVVSPEAAPSIRVELAPILGE
ncbi:MAG: Uma2 family endonuclease [Burkholderiales bacterium]|nr:Uma2 family endonuclease [Burkholderiales bacterium]